MAGDTIRKTLPQLERSSLRTVWLIAQRELRDTLHDWRIVTPIVILTLIFPWLMNWTAQSAVDFVQRREASIIGVRLIPFLLMIVGFFPISFSLVIALETFVGEKERRSIEPLLSMPITDLELYMGKMIAATALPLLGSILGISVYLGGLYGSVGYVPPLKLFVQIFFLNIMAALVMVSASVIVSSQTTSVRAANLLASFIIVPMAILIQGESIIMFWGDYDTLWIIVAGLVVVTLILIRMGVKTFNREEILGREIDELNLRRTGRLFRHFFLQPPVAAVDSHPPAGNSFALWRLLRWIARVYRTDLPYLLSQSWLAILIVTLFLVAAGGIGWVLVDKFPLPQGIVHLENLSMQDFQSMSSTNFLPSLTTLGILGHNVVALLLAGPAALVSLGVFAVLMLMAPIVVVGFMSGQIAWLGYNPLTFLAAFILPHGLFELPAAIVATAFALRIGASVTAPRQGMTVGEGLVAASADFVKVFLFGVVPLLLIAAFVEANLTPQIVIWLYGG
jgi:uncharacterized membrane protein SpoIIM required for sporulation/ABC-type transport system involved in multi-copper enzyme maturation permease subunit